MNDEANIALSKVKIRLMMNKKTIFYSTILFSLKIVWDDDDVPYAAVDGVHLFLNSKWFVNIPFDQQIGITIHEVLHVALSHMTRRGTRDAKIWNYAGDYIINAMLIAEGYKLPSWVLHKANKFKDMNTEQVYTKIYKEKPPRDFVSDVLYPNDPAAVKKIADKVANTVMRAGIAEKQAGNPGNIPAEIGIILDQHINPKLPWNIILQNHLSEFNQDDYTMRRPNRKYFPDFYLPTLYSEALTKIAVAVDSSGSVNDHEFSRFIHEIWLIQQTMKPKEMQVIDFDTRIKKIHDVDDTMDVLKDLKFSGRGGTNISEVMKWAFKNRPEILLIFSDGEFDLPNSYPPCSIIWLVHGIAKFNPKKGRVIRYEINN